MHPKAILDACTQLVRQTLALDHPADAVVSRFFREHRALGPRERATLAETAYAVLRRKPQFEHLARAGSGARERRLAILGLAAACEIPPPGRSRAGSGAPAGLRGGDAGGLAFVKQALSEPEKAWLDACLAVQPADLAPEYRHNLPQWLADALRAQLGSDDFDALAAALLAPAGLDLRVNTLLMKREQAAQSLRAAGVDSVPTPYSPWGLRLAGKPALNKLELFTSGAVEVQDEGSQLLALLLDARRGEMVVDFCAGAGGKTLAIGAAMRNTGRLYAFDVSAHRLEALKPRLARSGLSNVHPVALAHERDERVKRLAGKLDRVLVDAPCSGLGTLRRNPDLKWRQSPADVQELAIKQQAILTSAARLLKPGGRLVYATCSLLSDENEAVAQAFGAAHPDFALLNAAELLQALKVPEAAALCSPPAAGDGGAGGQGGAEPGRFLRQWPHRHGTDGFFAAVWQRHG